METHKGACACAPANPWEEYRTWKGDIHSLKHARQAELRSVLLDRVSNSGKVPKYSPVDCYTASPGWLGVRVRENRSLEVSAIQSNHASWGYLSIFFTRSRFPAQDLSSHTANLCLIPEEVDLRLEFPGH